MIFIINPMNTTFPVVTSQTVVGSGAGKHWKYERLVSVGLLAMIPTGLVYPNILCDYGIAFLLPLHNHW